MFKVTGILLVTLAAAASAASACSCAEAPSPSAALQVADVVVGGVVLGVGSIIGAPMPDSLRARGIVSSSDLLGWRIAVTEVWKGEAGDTMVIYSARYGSSCGIEFRVGQKYLIYGSHRRTKDLRNYFTITIPDSVITTTGRCTRTREFESAGEDLQQLPGPVWTSEK